MHIGITEALMAIIGLSSFVAWQRPKLMQSMLFNAYAIWHKKEWWRLLSAALVHVDFAHLFFNLFTLFFFGRLVEDAFLFLFPGKASLMYLLLFGCSVAGSQLPNLFRHAHNPSYYAAGASGGVVGVLFAAIVLFPRKKLFFLFIPVPVPAIWFAVGFLFYSYWAARRNQGHIDHYAHLFGGLIGMAFTFLLVEHAWQAFWYKMLR